MKCILLFTLVVALILLSQLSSGTDRYYSDLTAESENGRYRLVAESPDNRKVNTIVDKYSSGGDSFADEEAENETSEVKHAIQPFSDSFSYTMFKVDDGQRSVLWHRKFQKGDYAPVQIYASNAGYAVIYDGRMLRVVNPQGRDGKKLDVQTEVFTEKEREEKIVYTTAGEFWEDLSLWFWVKHSEKDYFVIATNWGRIIALEITSGRYVKEISAPLKKSIDNQLVEEVTILLAQAVTANLGGEETETCLTDSGENFHAAVFHSAFIKNPDPKVIEMLRDLEQVEEFESYSGWHFYEESTIGSPDMSRYAERIFRQLVHFALRRQGEVPQAYPCVEPGVVTEEASFDYGTAPKVSAKEKVKGVTKLEKGMSLTDILKLLGGPDYCSQRSMGFHIDADTPYSLELHFDKREFKYFTKTYPALWQWDRYEVANQF
ncbi:MAG: hypothetical protein AAF226_02700 [Verrucomicrobiota bacterium]